MTTAIFPGSFDPIHSGHVEVIERAHRLFDRIVVAVLRNSQKSDPFFSAEERAEMIESVSSNFGNVEVVLMSTLVVEVAKTVGADVIIRGLRAVSDFEYELQMAQMNQQLSGIETLFIPTGAAYSFISSRLVREIATYGGDVSHFVPAPIAAAIKARLVSDVEPPEEVHLFQDPASGEVDVAAVLDELADIVERAKSMPLSSSAIVAREELLELISIARQSLPTELARARRVLQDHDELRLRAEQEAEQLLDAARAQAAHLVSRTEVVRQARHEAERTLLDADAEARRVRHETEDYVDRKLASFEIVLDRTIRTVQAGRDRLAGTPAVPTEEPTEEEPGTDFLPFDQDQ